MAETIPRWNLADVNFLETDSAAIQSAIIAAYQSAAGRTLAAGDPVRLFLNTIAAAIIELRGQINIAAQNNLLSYAQGEFLDALGLYFGVSRLQASAAHTTLRFTLSQALAQDYAIPAGTEVTNGTVTFVTSAMITIPAGSTYADAAALCTTAGTAGNGYTAGEISTIVAPMAFVESASNTVETYGGSDAETDAELAERIRLAPNAFSCAGPRKAYIYHAKSVSSAIMDVAIETQEDNEDVDPGVVNVYVLMDGGELPGSEIIAAVQDHISGDTIRPLTDDVHTYAPEAVTYSINVDYWISKADSADAVNIQAAIEAAVDEYAVWQRSKIGRDISPEKLVQMVMAAGAARVNLSTLAPASFVQLAPGEVAQCSSTTVTYKGLKEE